MKIFSRNGKISEKDSKTNIVYSFTVSENTKRLTVNYSYFPKEVENREKALRLIEEGLEKYDEKCEALTDFLPIRNLITLSFDENGRYRGACHRHPNNQTIVISDENSTPGIINRPLEGGEWQVVLNVHYAGCEVDYSIEIEEETQ